jgi:hypothetical protein
VIEPSLTFPSKKGEQTQQLDQELLKAGSVHEILSLGMLTPRCQGNQFNGLSLFLKIIHFHCRLW